MWMINHPRLAKDGLSLKEFTEFYTQAFFKDIKSLNIIAPQKFTKATDYMMRW